MTRVDIFAVFIIQIMIKLSLILDCLSIFLSLVASSYTLNPSVPNRTSVSVLSNFKELSIDSDSGLKSKISDKKGKGSEIEINSSSKNENYDIFNSFHQTSTIIQNINCDFPQNVIQNIIGYNHNQQTQDAYDKVMDKLEISQKERKELNFYSSSFLEKFALVLRDKEQKFPKLNLFWRDSEKLLFKKIVHLKEDKTIFYASKTEFEEASKDIQSILFIISKKVYLNISFHFDLKTMIIQDFHPELLKSEFLENARYLIPRFVDALEYFYSPLWKEGRQTVDCESFKMRFFLNGNLDTDVLFKYFIIKFDLGGRMMKACVEHGTRPNYRKLSKKPGIKSWIKNDIDRLKKFEKIENFIGIPNMDYATNSIMNLIYSTKSKVSIRSEGELYRFLQRMKEAGLLQKEQIKEIAEFKCYEVGQYHWNLYSFNSLLENYRKYHSNTATERDFCNECLGLFRQSLL